jgi:hypothetical protein
MRCPGPYRILMILLLLTASVHAQLIRSIPAPDARLLTTDESGNAYIVRGKGELLRYNENGDSTGFYRSIANGPIAWVDATNPLRVMLYYQAFSKITLLDRMLSPKHELDLKKLSIFNPSATAVSADGKIWVYDYVNARLIKIDEQMNTNLTSNDLRMEIQTVPSPLALIEKDARVYACDTAAGILTFDRFGGYINTLEIKGVSKIQVVGKQIIYLQDSTLHAYDLQTFELKKMPLPSQEEPLLDARIERNRLYILYKNKLDIYARPE